MYIYIENYNIYNWVSEWVSEWVGFCLGWHLSPKFGFRSVLQCTFCKTPGISHYNFGWSHVNHQPIGILFSFWNCTGLQLVSSQCQFLTYIQYRPVALAKLLHIELSMEKPNRDAWCAMILNSKKIINSHFFHLLSGIRESMLKKSKQKWFAFFSYQN